jgi:hypothetical protein
MYIIFIDTLWNCAYLHHLFGATNVKLEVC